MKVKDIVNKNPKSCHFQTTLKEAALLMKKSDCGVLPVLDQTQKVTGMISDRDICLAVAEQDKRPSELQVKNIPAIMKERLIACSLDDDVEKCLQQMSKNQIRRIPVIDEKGRLYGVVSLNDIVLKAKEGKGVSPSYHDVLETFKGICEHTHHEPRL